MVSLTRRVFATLLLVCATAGCRADVQHYVVRSDLAAIDGAKVSSVRLDDGTTVRFDSARGVVGPPDVADICGRALDGDSLTIPFDRVAEADVRITTTSTPGTWLIACVTVVGIFIAVMSQFSAH